MVCKTMRGKCPQCGEQQLRLKSDDVVRVGIPWLTRLLQKEVEYVCTNCGRGVKGNVQSSIDSGNYCFRIPRTISTGSKVFEPHHTRIFNFARAPKQPGTILTYPAACSSADQVLFPIFEGTIGDGTVVDKHGDPDLMADFSEEYLRQFWTLLPSNRLPHTLKEIMPALLLLFTATELALKAFWIRSGRQMTSHSLIYLYRELDTEQKKNIEGRFAKSEPHSALSALGADAPTVGLILKVYSGTYGGASNVHMDSRYYAEPTTLFRQESGLRGVTLVKGNIPYPIFLPYVVRSLIDGYRFFSGHERLKRLGADLSEDGGERDTDNHGEWGLVPSSLGLVVVMVSQAKGKGLDGWEVSAFTEFKRMNPTCFVVDWMHGGNTLLFYRDGEQGYPDGKHVIDGLECRVWSRARLGLHERDLHLLADALECPHENEGGFGQLPKIRMDI